MSKREDSENAPENAGAERQERAVGKVVLLVGKAQKGDSGAFQALYEVYARKIVNYLFRMTGSRSIAEDLAQDTFVMAFRKIGTVKEPDRFQSWLFRIAQNNAYQYFRGQKVKLDSIDEDERSGDELRELPSKRQSPEQESLSVELEDRVQQAISELPEKYRTVFVLSAVQKMSYQQISAIVDRSLASVKSDIHRARVQVRDKIKEYLGDNYGMSGLY